MKHTEAGLLINKNEIAALLAFASESPENLKCYGIHFKLTDEKIRARATNGHIALDAVGENETGVANEWFVHRDFLKGANRVLENTHQLRLEFSGASLFNASIIDDDGNERSTFSWPHDAANSQTSFVDQDVWDKLLKPPRGERSVRFITLNGEYLAMLSKVCKAAGTSGVDCYPPPKAEDMSVFRVEGLDTTWIAVVAPMRGGDDQTVESAAQEFESSAQALPEGTELTVDCGGHVVTGTVRGRKKK